MSLTTCRWERTGPRCGSPADAQRQIPGRERLKTYPVCRWHSAMIDVGDARRDPAGIDDFARTSALLIEAAEAITRRSAL